MRSSVSRIGFTFCGLSGLFFSLGCMTPGMYYGYPYGQPGYAPPRMLNQPAPGTLVIPESEGEPYDPGGSTYDEDPDDDFWKENTNSDDTRFFGTDDDDSVPQPQDLNDRRFENDLGGSSTNLDTDGTSPHANSGIQLASHSMTMPAEHGFDRANYAWLRGTLHYDKQQNVWFVRYSLQANDRFQGILPLNITQNQLSGLRDGSPVDVEGTLNEATEGASFYDVALIRPMTTQVPM